MRVKNVLKAGLFCILLGLMILAFCQTTAVCYAAEEPADTVYLTISEDGSPLIGKDGTLLAHVPVTLESFDLAAYGLQEYKYQDGSAPTLLHLLIRATEQYYLGRTMVPADIETKAFHVTCGPGSLYLKDFWGHNENLMYFVNHEYPLKAAGIGATADTIELGDGDTVDLAMFSNWSFRYQGQFAYFAEEEAEVAAGDEALMTLATVPTAGVSTGSSGESTPMAGASIRVSRDGGQTWVWDAARTDASGKAALRFADPGTYVAVSGPAYEEYQDVAPGVCVITVTGSAADPSGCVDFSKESAADPSAKPSEEQDESEEQVKLVPTGIKLKIGKAAITKVTAGRKAFRVKWKKVAGATFYQIQYSRDRHFKKNVKTVKVKKYLKKGKKIGKLKAKKKYYVRVRAVRKADGKTYRGKWSKVKGVKVKK